MTRKQPNLLFIIADDHRASALGCYGSAEVATPNIDALAARGTRFANAHCQGSMHPAVCVPSRASIMTGRDIFAASCELTGSAYEGASFAIPPDLKTFPQVLRERGYRTHAVGKWHNDTDAFARSFSGGDKIMFGGMGDHDAVHCRPYDPTGRFPEESTRVEEGFSTDIFSDAATDFLESIGPDAPPFCLYVAYTAPHDPRTPPPEYRPDPDTLSLPPSFMPVHPFDNGEMRVRDELLDTVPRTPEMVRRHLADYYGMINHLDARIGTVLKTLRDRGLEDDTIVVYVADHGLALGNHGLLGKQNLYQHSLHVPLILAGPGIEAGTTVDDLVWHPDLHGSLLAMTDPENGQDAKLPGEPGRHLFAAYRFNQRMARNERYKLIRYTTSDRAPPGHTDGPGMQSTPGSSLTQLFDLQNDPDELVNLAHDPAFGETIRELEAALIAWQRDVGDPLLAKA